MGWDIVAIGTNHNLPVKDPVKTAEKIAPLFDGPISVGYYETWIYDEKHNSIVTPGGKWQWKEIARVNTDKNGPLISFEISNYCVRKIYAEVRNKLELVKFEDEEDREMFQYLAKRKLFELYICSCKETHSINLWIFREIVEFSVKFPGRWNQFERKFKNNPDSLEAHCLHDFRKFIYKQYQVCGCDMAYYFADQGPGEKLMDRLNLTSKKWRAYLDSGGFVEKGNDPKIMKICDYVAGDVILNDEDWVDCFIDDFSDLANT